MKLNYLRLMPRKDFQVWTIFQWLATVTGQKLGPLSRNKTELATPELLSLDRVSEASLAWAGPGHWSPVFALLRIHWSRGQHSQSAIVRTLDTRNKSSESISRPQRDATRYGPGHQCRILFCSRWHWDWCQSAERGNWSVPPRFTPYYKSTKLLFVFPVK